MSTITNHPQPGDPVRAGSELCELRPELAGASGTVETREGDEAVVEFKGLPRRYRVLAAHLEKGK